jgi:hypothetical protein
MGRASARPRMLREEYKRDRRGGINLSDPHNAKIWRDELKRHPTGPHYMRKMRRAYRRDHPGEAPLPEHFCELDNPYPGFKRWAAKVLRWIDNYERT